MTDFVHCHNHSEYSLLDGMSTPEEMAEIASTNGMTATAITDHGTMGGFLRFQKACKKHDVNPVFGIEAYFVDDVDEEDRENKAERFHLILLAKNDVGLENLFGISNVAWTEQFYYKPLIDFSNLEQYSEGLICLSGCMGSALSQAIINGDDERADKLLNRFYNIFQDDYYVEVQPHNPVDLNAGLFELADSYNIPVVGTLDCHFPRKQDQGFEEVLLMMGQKASLNAADSRYAKDHFKESCAESDLIKKMDILYPNRRLSFKNLPLYMMDADEVVQNFKDAGWNRSDIFENSVEIADKCNAEIKLNQMYLPSYTKDIKISESSNDYLRELAFFYLEERGLNNDEYRARLEEELAVIIDKNFSDYFLILWDIVTWADNNDIARGVGRGSAGGSLLSYVLNITKVDPIKYGLLFFRFINAERNDFPDIDLDFEHNRRDDVKEYVRQRWGAENVAGVAAYGTFKAKGAIKDCAATFQIPYLEANKATSYFEDLDEYKKTDKLIKFRNDYPDLQKVAEKLDGRYRTASAHAAGVVISKVPLHKIVPVEVRTEAKTKRKIPVVAYDKDEVGDFGLIKFDPLSVVAISVIKDCINKIKERHGIDVEDQSLDIDNPDPRVFEEFTKGNVVGIFQAEGAGYAKLIQDMGIHDFNDLVVSNALVRPGSFVTQGKTYLAVRDGRKQPRYNHDILKDILQETHGTYIFEEQVMKISVELAGFSWSKADRLRKIISKKKDQKEFDAYKDEFLEGASQHITYGQAETLWKQIEKASLYMFNKSHATEYSLHSYQTMWLKVNYPLEFMWATLYNEKVTENVTTYVFEANRLGIEVLPPDVNISDGAFTLDGDKLRFGIQNISGAGESCVEEVLSNRPYNSYEEFVSKVAKSKVKKNILANMEKIGFFESIGYESGYDKNQYYGTVLNWHTSMGQETEYDEIITDCSYANDDKGSKSLYIVRGVVKSTKRTPRYFRVELEDETGIFSSFADKEAAINKKEYLVAIVGDQTIHHTEAFSDIEAGSQSKFAQFLNWNIDPNADPNPYDIVYQHGIKMGVDHEQNPFLAYLINTVTFKTKKGSDMGSVYCWVPSDAGGGEWFKATVFPKVLAKRAGVLGNPFEWVLIKSQQDKSNNVIEDIIPVVDWMSNRNIAV